MRNAIADLPLTQNLQSLWEHPKIIKYFRHVFIQLCRLLMLFVRLTIIARQLLTIFLDFVCADFEDTVEVDVGQNKSENSAVIGMPT